ncbi:MAG: restriction endonuclease subunit S [Alphaproteobacteria bacterium]|nr:restriction endonuclease subunit S [Alphaproteobacteria bacterium]
MNPDMLLAHYDRIADAPDAIARLRRFILDLAVRGKLVPQDPNDEPASELLKRIAAEKARLGIRDALEPLASEEVPFALLKGWAWTRIGEICSKTGSGSTPRGGKEVYVESGVPFLRSQNVYDDGLRLDDVAYIAADVHARMSGTAVKPADLLLNITGGSMGRCCRVPDGFGEANISQHVAIIRSAIDGMTDFLHKLVLAPYFQAFIFGKQTGAGRGGLPKNRMDRIAVALPPLAEQHRIVAKVDELMALCDRLEAARKEREATRDRLALSSLARLNAPDPETFQADARFALNNLSALTTRPDQIKQLRQTILNLAVRGKLVPQDPNDEPASELLKRIAAEKARLVKAGEIKSPREASVPAEAPFSVPSNWRWSQLSEIGVLSPRNEAPDVLEASFVPMPLIAADYGVANQHEVRPWGEIKKGYTHFAEGDVGLAKITPCFENGKSTVFRNLTGGIGSGTTELHIVRPLFIEQDYILLFLKSPHFIETGIPKMTGTAGQKRVPTEYFAHSPFPLPPLAEQHRIVAKVDELMALCDRLEASLSTCDDTRRCLLESILHHSLALAA